MTVTMPARPRLIIDADEEIRLALRLRAMKEDKGMSEIAVEILREALSDEIRDAKKYAPKRPKRDD